MKRIVPFTIILIALTACAAPQTQAGMPNPASVYCTQKGNKLEIRTAADGSQSGICVLPDGSICDEGPISGVSVAWQLKKAQHLPS